MNSLRKDIYKKLLWFIFPISIIVDLMNGFMQIQLGEHTPIGLIYRGIILITLFLYVRYLNVGYLLYYILLLLLMFLSGLLVWSFGDNINIISEMYIMSNIFYLIFMVVFFFANKGVININRSMNFISNYALLISLAVILSFITGYGNYSYGRDGSYGFGTKSYFKAGNDLSLALSFAGVYSQIYFFKIKSTIFPLLRLLLVNLSLFLVGSRTGMFMGFFMIIFTFLYCFRKTNNFRLMKNYHLLFFAVSVMCGSVVFAKYIYNSLDNYALKRLTVESMVEARIPLIENAKTHIEDFKGIEVFFGKGASSLYKHAALRLRPNAKERSIEADLYDIIGCYGYFFGSVILLFPIIFLCISINNYMSNRCLVNFLLCFLFFLFVTIGFLYGHAIKNVMVAPIYGFSVYLLFVARNRIKELE